MKPEITAVLGSAVQFLPEAVVLTEIENGLEKIIFVNHAFERLTGYSAEELRGSGLTLLQSQETGGLLPMLAGSSDELPGEAVLRRKDGTLFRNRISSSKIRMGKKWYSVQVHSDVTQQREIENRFILAQKREATSHLVSGLAHDFNNLLTAILVYSGLVGPKLKGDEQLQRYMGEIRGAAERGAQLVAELMNLGREDVAEAEMVDLRELVKETSDLLRRILGEDIALKTATAPDLHKVKVHAGRIQQVLLNLGINARDAMPNGGDFFIRLTNHEVPARQTASGAAAGSYVLIEVSDSGTGMDRETCASLFKPFFSTKGKGKGTGLGLFTARTIVEHYQGRIGVESEPGKGATFRILLPATLPAGPPVASKATLLLVEGEEVVRRSLDATLSLRGYKVLPAADGNQALEVAQSYAGEISLLLANAQMPGMGGPRLGRKILKVRPEIKLLFMCGQDNLRQRLSGDASAFVKRPFTPSVLVHKIEQVLNRPAKS